MGNAHIPRTCVCLCVYVCTHASTCTHIHTCAYACIYIWTKFYFVKMSYFPNTLMPKSFLQVCQCMCVLHMLIHICVDCCITCAHTSTLFLGETLTAHFPHYDSNWIWFSQGGKKDTRKALLHHTYIFMHLLYTHAHTMYVHVYIWTHTNI